MTLGEKLSALRKKGGLTQTQLGEKLNLSAQAVSKWENNLAEPDITTIKKLAIIYGVSIGDIVNCGGEEEKLDAEELQTDNASKGESMQILLKEIDYSKKIAAIKLLMDYIGLPEYGYAVSKYAPFRLKEAKNAVENLPCIIRFEDKNELEKFKKAATELGCNFEQAFYSDSHFFIKEYVAPSAKTREDIKQRYREQNKGLLAKYFTVSIIFALIPIAVCTALFFIFGCNENALRNGLIFLGVAYVLASFVFQWRYDSVPVSIIGNAESGFTLFILFVVAIVVSPFTFPVSLYERIRRIKENNIDEIYNINFDKRMNVYIQDQDIMKKFNT